MAQNLKILEVLEPLLIICSVVVVMVFLVQICFSEVKFVVIISFVVLSSFWVFSFIFTEETTTFTESIRYDSNERRVRYENLLTNLAFSSTVVGMVFLSLSSFSGEQFGEDHRLQCVLVVILTAFFVAFTFLRKNIISFLKNVYGKLSTKAMVECISFATVSGVAFLIKYPRFNIHSPELTTSCIHEDQEINQIYHRIRFRLFFYGAFSLLSLLVSFPRQETVALKVSSCLLGFTIETSMEIPGRDGPNLRYMFATALCKEQNKQENSAENLH